MKCQKCGKNEVSFHYASSINGCVTETHLCSECATESGYDIGRMFDMESVLDGMFPILGRPGGFMPVAIPMLQADGVLPLFMRPHLRMIKQRNSCDCGCGKQGSSDENVEVDEKLSKRRELNMQMRAAVEKEDFEKAAQLRDEIKELEAEK